MTYEARDDISGDCEYIEKQHRIEFLLIAHFLDVNLIFTLFREWIQQNALADSYF
jgi:hypothetical protein